MSEAAAEQTQQASAEAQQTQQTQQADNSFSIPEQYADKGWAKTIKSSDDLWSQFDNTQALLGKRPAGIPAQDAPQEEWDKFYQALGRPEAPDQYELKEGFEGLPEGLELTEAKQKAAELAHNIGLSPDQASRLWEGYISMEMEALQGQEAQKVEREAQLDKEFDELGGKLFGDQFDDASKKAQAYLKEMLPEELSGVTEDLAGNPKALLAMIKIAHDSQNQIAQVKKEYGAEDKLSTGDQASGESVNDINAQLVDAKSRYSKAQVFSPERKAIEEEIEVLRGRLRKAT